MTARFCFLIPEDEDVEHRQIEWQTQHELANHHPGQDFVGGIVGCFAVVNRVVRRHVCLDGHNQGRSCPAVHSSWRGCSQSPV